MFDLRGKLIVGVTGLGHGKGGKETTAITIVARS